MTSPFERLPPEIFDIIAAHYDLRDYQMVRLASRRLHLLSLSNFNQNYFTKFTTTLGSSSLDRLVHVANSHLSRLVTTLEVKLLTHRNYKDLIKITQIGIFPPPKRFPKVSCIRDKDIAQESTLYDDVYANKHPKCITDPLARALRSLSNLTTLRLRLHSTEDPHLSDGDSVFRARCLRAVLDALQQSPTRLDSLTLSKEKPFTLLKSLNAPLTALQLPLDYTQRLLRPAFSTLSHLALSLTCAHSTAHPRPGPGWETTLSRLLSTAPRLTSLTLSLDRAANLSPCGARILRSLSDTLHLTHLTRLQLFNTTAHEADVAKVLKTHAATLHTVNLTNVRLLTGTWAMLLSALRGVRGLEVLRLCDVEGVGGSVGFRVRGKVRRRVLLDAVREGREMLGMLDEVVQGCEGGEGVVGVYALSGGL